MATGARLSIMGLYNYNPEIFSDLNVPTGIDKETVIDNILLECYDLELLFPSYNLMKIAIKNWSDVEQPIWQKLYNTENLEYNPIWNVDGDVTEKREVTRARSGQDSRTINQTGNRHSETEFGINEQTTGSDVMHGETSGTSGNNLTVQSTDSTSGTSQNTHSEAGYNSESLVITERDDGTTSTTGQGTRTENGTGTTSGEQDETRTTTGSKTGTNTEETTETSGNTETGSGTNSESETVGEELHTRRTGNIGVTTTQSMIREERDVAQFSTIKYITNSFKKRFCLLVY